MAEETSAFDSKHPLLVARHDAAPPSYSEADQLKVELLGQQLH